MKLLLDQGLPRSAASLLREAGIDAVHVGEKIAKPIIRWDDSPQLGYEILPNKYFYRYQPPRPAKELLAEFWKLEKEAENLLKGLAE